MNNTETNKVEIIELTADEMLNVDGGSNCGLGAAILGLSAMTGNVPGAIIGALAVAIYC